MQPNDLPRFVELISALAAVMSREVDEALLAGYEIGLDGMTIDAVEVAVMRALRESKFMPSPTELRALAGDVPAADKAVLAFNALDRAVSDVGVYRSPDFDDPLINAVVRILGGWEYVCNLSLEEFNKWFRKDFLKTYEAVCRSGVDGDMTAPLVGIHERNNALLGYDSSKYVRVVKTGLPWGGTEPKRLQQSKHDVPQIDVKLP